MIYITYGIIDPNSELFVYVGQTADFEKRKRSHLRLRSKRPNYGIGFENIKTRLFDLLSNDLIPEVVILEECQDEDTSLLSETSWVEKLASEGHPLLNRWKEHRKIVKKYKKKS